MRRYFVDTSLHKGVIDLPEGAARHVQVRRQQPGDMVVLFNGAGGEWHGVIADMRRRVAVEVLSHRAVEREAPRQISIAVGMPANENMDWLVEKATELGVVEIQALICERSVLRLKGERAEKRRAHWQGVAQSACEQCGRNRVPTIHEPRALSEWLDALSANTEGRFVLSTAEVPSLNTLPAQLQTALFLSGPEGGLTPEEEAQAMSQGFVPLSLGSRILRAETAPITVLARLNTP